ncbi:C69 family dipeptidase [Ligilactobacillus equi]
MTVTKQELSACTSILIGKKASIDGSTIIGRNEDAKSAWPKHLVIHPRTKIPNHTFISNDTGLKLNLPEVAYKYSATPEWTDKFGLFEEDGINEYGVAMSATESAYANQRVLGADPFVTGGISEEAMVTVVLPYVKTARQGILRLGQIIQEHGTSEANGILFADQDEVWYMEVGSGHYWVAQRIPDDAYAVVANQLAIQEIDFEDPDNFLFAPGIQEFVAQNHLNPHPNGFNFRQIFGTQTLSDEIYSTPRVWYGQKMFNPEISQDPMSEELPFIRKASRLLDLKDATDFLSSHYQGTEYDPVGQGSSTQKHKFRPISLAKTQEAHVLQIRPNLPPAIAGIQWLAMGVAAQSVFVPIYPGASDVHPAYKIGQEEYQPDSAYWIYKHVGVLADAHYHEFMPLVKEVQEKLNIYYRYEVHASDIQALKLEGQDLTNFLTEKNITWQAKGIEAYQQLSHKLITLATDKSPLNFKTDANL